MSPPLTQTADIQLELTTHLSGRWNERLSWPGWLTYSGRFTHISGHPSDTGRAKDRESSPATDRRSTTVPRNQPWDHHHGRQCKGLKGMTDPPKILHRLPAPLKFWAYRNNFPSIICVKRFLTRLFWFLILRRLPDSLKFKTCWRPCHPALLRISNIVVHSCLSSERDFWISIREFFRWQFFREMCRLVF